jgi:hypothetical protein
LIAHLVDRLGAQVVAVDAAWVPPLAGHLVLGLGGELDRVVPVGAPEDAEDLVSGVADRVARTREASSHELTARHAGPSSDAQTVNAVRPGAPRSACHFAGSAPAGSSAACGRRWRITSHIVRKTNATILDDAGLSARQIADHLDHARPSLTQDVYMGRRAKNRAAAAAPEQAHRDSAE